MLPQPVPISVSQLREELWRASPPAPVAEGPSALMGSLFHRTMAGMLSGEACWASILTEENLEDHALLRRHAYERVLGPQLTRHAAALQESGRQVMWLWAAVGEACQWLCGILKAAREEGWIRYDAEADCWIGRERLLLSEQAVSRDFQQPHWRAAVRISGVADAILRDPKTKRWCCLEFKLGDGLGPLDLSQVAMYRSLINDDASTGDIALVRFVPGRKERILGASALESATSELLNLAGRLAGVIPEEGERRSLSDPKAKENLRHAVQERSKIAHIEKQIIEVLRSFGLQTASAGDPIIGPAFIRFSLKPGRAVSVNKILNRGDDIGIQLGVDPPRVAIEDGTLVIDVSRRDRRELVPFSRVAERLPEAHPLQGSAKIPLGVDLNGQVFCIDLAAAESPHVLVAGTAGSGKSEWLRTAIASLLLRNTPDTLRLVLVDPKHVGFRDLATSPFLLHNKALVLPPDGSVVEQLDLLINEMERRYREFQAAAVDDLSGWRAATRQFMPRIVCVVDEFADMMTDTRQRKLLEDRVVRLGAKARAAGIHLILATQHPDHKTVTGRLRANLAVRVCLRTTTWQQSMVALQQKGAERLLGKGDLFYSLGDRLWRYQAAYLSDAERREIFGQS